MMPNWHAILPTPPQHGYHTRPPLEVLMRCGGGLRKRAKRALKPEMFDRYQGLARVILSVDGRPDEDTVQARYDGDKLGEVTDLKPVPRNVMDFAQKVRQAYGSCRLLDEVYDAAQDVTEEDFQAVSEHLQKRLSDVSAELDEGGGKPGGDGRTDPRAHGASTVDEQTEGSPNETFEPDSDLPF